MNVDELVVLTYPRHILITGIAVREAIRFQNWNKHVTVVYDDLFKPSYTTFKDDLYWSLKKVNPNTSFNLIPFSSHIFVNTSLLKDIPMQTGWIRQQLVKLFLDEILTTNNWFVIDGDCLLTSHIKDNTIPYTKNCVISGLTQKFKNYWDFIFQKTEHHKIYTNSIPFRFLDRTTLTGMRDYIATLHNSSFKNIHSKLIADGLMTYDTDDMIISEWDIIEYYRLHILQEDHHHITPFGLNMLPNVNTNNTIDILYGEDADLGKQWFADKGMNVTSNEFKNIISNWMPERCNDRCYISVSELMEKWNFSSNQNIN